MTNELLNTLIKSVQMASKPKTSPYDSTAVVKRIEDGVAWVQIPGGVDETPVKLTVNAEAGDTVQVRVSGGTAFLVGNSTAPPTDDTKANAAQKIAVTAQKTADGAVEDAERAKNAADDAERSAASAQTSANNANEYASRALSGLSTVQSVAETLTWITQHGTMTLTTDTEIDPTHVYFVQDAEGDYVVGNVHYSVVAEPKAADLATYYVLSIDESLNNYVATHLALTSEGLWVVPDSSGYKVLIATGQGQTYTEAGTYIIDASGNTVAKFGASGATIGKSNAAHSVIDANGQRFYGGSDGTQQLANIGYGQGAAESGTAIEPYYTFGSRASGSTIGNYSTAEGYNTTASGYASHSEGRNSVASGHLSHTEGEQTEATAYYGHAEGNKTHATGMASHAEGSGSRASGVDSHAEGNLTTASGFEAHAEGRGTIASGADSHAQNRGTIAQRLNQTAIGMYNEADTAGADGEHYGDYVFIIGNGTSDSARSNALTVDWNGNVKAAGHVSGTYTDLTITPINNPYVNATYVGYLRAVRKDGMLWFNGNIGFSTAMPSGIGWVEIAKISNWNAPYGVYATVAGQQGGGILTVMVTEGGSVQIYNNSGGAVNGFHRCPMVAPATD